MLCRYQHFYKQGNQYGSRSPKKVKEIILARGHVCEAYVSFAVSPTDFSIQLTDLSDKLDALMEELARHCERSYNEKVTRATPQLLVAAKSVGRPLKSIVHLSILKSQISVIVISFNLFIYCYVCLGSQRMTNGIELS